MLVVNQGEVAVIKGFVGQVSVDISANQAQAREQEATGEAAYVRLTGQAEADPTQAIGLAEAKATQALGLAKATGFEAQREAIGELATAAVAVAGAIADGQIDIMPEVLVTGGGGALDGLAATLMRTLRAGTPVVSVPDAVEAEAIVEEVDEELSAPEPKPVA